MEPDVLGGRFTLDMPRSDRTVGLSLPVRSMGWVVKIPPRPKRAPNSPPLGKWLLLHMCQMGLLGDLRMCVVCQALVCETRYRGCRTVVLPIGMTM